MKHPYRILTAGLLGLAGIIAARTSKFSRPWKAVQPVEGPPINPGPPAEHLAGLIRCQTVSLDVGKQVDASNFLDLHRRLDEYYPKIHACLEKETVNELSLLYTWVGSQPGLPPLLLAAHQDVVPAGKPEDWQQPPFDGVIKDGYVWGRGALDIKNQLAAVMEAVEYLLTQGYRPKRTVYLAFGHDEEIGGPLGAYTISETLKQRGVRLGAVVDEGGMILEDALPGVCGPVALVGTGEKGYLTLRLKVESQPGHSSTPPRETVIGILSRALFRLESCKFPPDINLILPILNSLGDSLSPKIRLLAANTWLFKPALLNIMDSNPRTSAIIRTTTAPTIISGGSKENILPEQASAMVNFRLIPGESQQDVVRMVKARIRDDRVKVIQPEWGGWEATAQSPVDSPYYQDLEMLIRQSFDNPPVTPYLVLGGTDARYYASICPNVYRFSPLRLTAETRKGVHGVDERIAVDDLGKMVQFFVELIQRWDDLDDHPAPDGGSQ